MGGRKDTMATKKDLQVNKDERYEFGAVGGFAFFFDRTLESNNLSWEPMGHKAGWPPSQSCILTHLSDLDLRSDPSVLSTTEKKNHP